MVAFDRNIEDGSTLSRLFFDTGGIGGLAPAEGPNHSVGTPSSDDDALESQNPLLLRESNKLPPLLEAIQ